jgi:hypothetical protein
VTRHRKINAKYANSSGAELAKVIDKPKKLKNPALEAKKLQKKTEFQNTDYIESLLLDDNPDLVSQVRTSLP